MCYNVFEFLLKVLFLVVSAYVKKVKKSPVLSMSFEYGADPSMLADSLQVTFYF